MRPFKLLFTGDYLDESGKVSVGDIGLDKLSASGFVETEFLRDQQPPKGDATYWDRLYSLEITPEHIAKANGIVIFRPWIKSSVFVNGAKDF